MVLVRFGGIVGLSREIGKINSCVNNGTIGNSVTGSSGGIAGVLWDGEINSSTNNGNIRTKASAGGIVGVTKVTNLNNKVKISYCSNVGIITNYGRNDGEMDYYEYNGNSIDYYNTPTGGIVGQGYWLDITNCRNSAKIESLAGSNGKDGYCIGGIVGLIRKGTVSKCYNESQVLGSNKGLHVGGIAGESIAAVTIIQCYNKGNISGEGRVAGIVGLAANTTVKGCFNVGTITGSTTESGKGPVGGIVGVMFPRATTSTNNFILYCYNAGEVIGSTINKGSICGRAVYANSRYLYSLENIVKATSSSTGTNNIIGSDENRQGADTSRTNGNKTNLCDSVINNFVENGTSYFKADSSNINNGYPVCNW